MSEDLVQTQSRVALNSRASLWTARLVGGLFVLFMLLDTLLHFIRPAAVVEAFARLGLPLRLAPVIAIVELVCTLLYVIPRARVLGAVLLTGLLGGAVATHLRVGSSLFEAVIFPILMGLMIWTPLYLTEPRLGALLPLRAR